MPVSSSRERRLRRFWDRHADTYDQTMTIAERRYFRDTRPWLAGQAAGETLEVAIGTGLNLPYYPAGVRLTGIEWSPSMLAVAARRAPSVGLDPDLRTGGAQGLPFPDRPFDTGPGTFGRCAGPHARPAPA